MDILPRTDSGSQKGMTYGFRLRSETGLVDMAEAAEVSTTCLTKRGMGWASPSEESR